MDKELLHKYFQAETSPAETEKVLAWIEMSAENYDLFLSERKLWNLSILMNNSAVEKEIPPKKSHNTHFWLQYIWPSVAAVAILTLIFAGISFFMPSVGGYEQIVSVPIGQRANMTLADGTKVWLNSNTTFTYPTDFNKAAREVSIDGEAYFEVAHDSKRPFVVHTQKCNVEVLGTKFNVRDYKGSDIFETSVTEGSVKISEVTNEISVILKHDEKVNLINGSLQKTIIEKEPVFNWQNGVLVFNDEPIVNVLNLLSAYYDKNIIMEFSDTTDYRCTAKFSYNDGLDYILRIIQKDLHFDIQKDRANNTIILR